MHFLQNLKMTGWPDYCIKPFTCMSFDNSRSAGVWCESAWGILTVGQKSSKKPCSRGAKIKNKESWAESIPFTLTEQQCSWHQQAGPELLHNCTTELLTRSHNRLDIRNNFSSKQAAMHWHGLHREWWRHHPWRGSGTVEMWHLGMWFSGDGSTGGWLETFSNLNDSMKNLVA